MENNRLEQHFKSLEGQFDIYAPAKGHQERFLEKLKQQDKALEPKPKQTKKWSLALAAILVIGLGLFTLLKPTETALDLAAVSPEMSKTQLFFTAAIEHELTLLNNARTPATESLINDALSQLSELEKQYHKLKLDLTKSGNDKRVIYAMISNFQMRIEVLQTVLNQINEVKQLNQQNNATKITL